MAEPLERKSNSRLVGFFAYYKTIKSTNAFRSKAKEAHQHDFNATLLILNVVKSGTKVSTSVQCKTGLN